LLNQSVSEDEWLLNFSDLNTLDDHTGIDDRALLLEVSAQIKSIDELMQVLQSNWDELLRSQLQIRLCLSIVKSR